MKQRRLQPELAGLFVGKNSREGLHTKNVVEVSVLCSECGSGKRARWSESGWSWQRHARTCDRAPV